MDRERAFGQRLLLNDLKIMCQERGERRERGRGGGGKGGEEGGERSLEGPYRVKGVCDIQHCHAEL